MTMRRCGSLSSPRRGGARGAVRARAPGGVGSRRADRRRRHDRRSTARACGCSRSTRRRSAPASATRGRRRGLARLIPPGTTVTLESDPPLDRVDRYGRLLRYVRAGGRNVNVDLVRRGAATVYFYRGERGRYASASSRRRAGRAARQARAVGSVPGDLGHGRARHHRRRGRAPAASGCDPSYPGTLPSAASARSRLRRHSAAPGASASWAPTRTASTATTTAVGCE